MSIAWLVVPVLVGLSQPVLWQMNVRVATHLGVMEAAVLLHVVGTAAGLGWVAGGLRGAGFSGLGALPWWVWLAGVIGVTGMAAMNRAIPEVGVSAALAVLVAAQLVASLVFEKYGWLGSELRDATPSRWLGVALLTLGAWLISRAGA